MNDVSLFAIQVSRHRRIVRLPLTDIIHAVVTGQAHLRGVHLHNAALSPALLMIHNGEETDEAHEYSVVVSPKASYNERITNTEVIFTDGVYVSGVADTLSGILVFDVYEAAL